MPNELGQAPYVEMGGVWLPFGRRALKNQKLRSFLPVGDGTFVIVRSQRMSGTAELHAMAL